MAPLRKSTGVLVLLGFLIIAFCDAMCSAGFGTADFGATCVACLSGSYKTTAGDTTCSLCDENASGCGGISAGLCSLGMYFLNGICTSCASSATMAAAGISACDYVGYSEYSVGSFEAYTYSLLGVSTIRIWAFGAKGSDICVTGCSATNRPRIGGLGGYISANMATTNYGSFVNVVMGPAPDIRTSPLPDFNPCGRNVIGCNSLSSRLLVAGAGGWGNSYSNEEGGAGGGLVGQTGAEESPTLLGGGGGTQTAGGSASSTSVDCVGTFGFGGAGYGINDGGTGGDGWYGGGGGAHFSGGGGGSSYAAPAATILANTQGYHTSQLSMLYIAATSCSPGYNLIRGICFGCTAGSYHSSGVVTTCTACNTGYSRPNQVSAGSTSDACSICSAGFAGTSGSTGPVGTDGCAACPSGKYSEPGNASPCIDCDANKTGCGGAMAGQCNAGFGTADNGITCVRCPYGKFKETVGNARCTSCIDYSIQCGGASGGTCVVGMYLLNNKCSPCSSSTIGAIQLCDYTGFAATATLSSFTTGIVPYYRVSMAGVAQMRAWAFGAAGSDIWGTSQTIGGNGGYMSIDLPVALYENMFVTLGPSPDIRINSTLSSRVFAVGAGGWGNSNKGMVGGSGGGLIGGKAPDYLISSGYLGGTGGTQTSGGMLGASQGFARVGTFGYGGSGYLNSNRASLGGAGGDGWYGGGGGAPYSGGGGGSSYAISTATILINAQGFRTSRTAEIYFTASSCTTGYYLSGGACYASCPVGTYQSTSSCNPCNTGYSAPDIGTPGADTTACTVCAAGYSGTSGRGGDVGTSGCTACVNGKYKYTPGNTECLFCSTNSSGCGETLAGFCNPGFSSSDMGVTCTACSPNSFKVSVGNTECLSCANHSDCGGASAGICDAGFGTSDNGVTCNACISGTYKSSVSNSGCILCSTSADGCGGVSAGTCRAGLYFLNEVCTSCSTSFLSSLSLSTACDYTGYARESIGSPISFFYTLPNVAAIRVWAFGAKGGNSGGNGGFVSASLAVVANSQLTVVLGPAPDVRTNSSDLNTRLVVAGAGGWGSNLIDGVDTQPRVGGAGGGLVGADGQDARITNQAYRGGTGGTQSSGGISPGSYLPGRPGVFGYGGAGYNQGTYSGGNGGDGWYGGGGGGQISAGGGGSSFVVPGATILSNMQGYFTSELSQLFITITGCVATHGLVAGTCNACGIGSYLNAATCTSCAAGTYKAVIGNGACGDCPAGKYVIITGASVCTDCPQGKYGTSEGKSSETLGCQNCPNSTQAQTGATACYDAPTGQPTSQPSIQPTTQPTSQPSMQPTSLPTTQPTSRPSNKPTSQPASHPSAQPTGYPTFLSRFNESLKTVEYGYSSVNSETLDYEGFSKITGIGSDESIFLSILLWQSGFADGFVKFFTSDAVGNEVELSSALGAGPVAYPGSCKPTANLGIDLTGTATKCNSRFFPCRFNINVSPFVRSAEGGSLTITTRATGINARTATSLPCRKQVGNTKYAVYVQFVIGDKQYGACNYGEYFEACGHLDPDCNSCNPCPSGTWSDGTAVNLSGCVKCPQGQWSNAGFARCQNCQPGSYATAAGGSQKCPIGTYVAVEGASACIACPKGKTTAAAGSIDEDDCISAIFNFVTAFFALLIVILLGIHYVVQGRFRRVAFVRNTRVVQFLNTDTQDIISYISYFNLKVKAERVLGKSKRRVYTWIFILSFAFLLLFGIGTMYVSELGEIFFKSMIILKSLELPSFELGSKLKVFAADFFSFLGTEWMSVVISPFVSVIDYLGRFKVDLKAIEVTCDGTYMCACVSTYQCICIREHALTILPHSITPHHTFKVLLLRLSCL